MEKEIIQAIKEDRLYDFIANNYWRIEREMLRDLILEIYYVLLYDTEIEIDADVDEVFKERNNKIIKSLKENRDWEE